MTNNRSQQGYQKQREQTQEIIDKTAGMKSVRHEDSKGRAVKSAKDVREGPDRGIDLVTKVETKNKQALSRVLNLLDKKLG